MNSKAYPHFVKSEISPKTILKMTDRRRARMKKFSPYYKMYRSAPDSLIIDHITDSSKYVIVHTKDSMLHLSNPEISNGKIVGDLTKLSDDHIDHNMKKYFMGINFRNGFDLYRYKRNKSSPDGEVHLFLSIPQPFDVGETDIAVEDISNVDVYFEEKGFKALSVIASIGWVFISLILIGFFGLMIFFSVYGDPFF